MSFLGNIFGSAVGEGFKGVSEGVVGLAKGIRTAITGIDPDKQAELEKLALQADQLANQSQTEINKIEASHKSIFIAGWRPFIGWVCGVGLAWHFIGQPLLNWLFYVVATFADFTLTPPPKLDVKDLIAILLTMLGFGGYRSWEKGKKVQSEH